MTGVHVAFWCLFTEKQKVHESSILLRWRRWREDVTCFASAESLYRSHNVGNRVHRRKHSADRAHCCREVHPGDARNSSNSSRIVSLRSPSMSNDLGQLESDRLLDVAPFDGGNSYTRVADRSLEFSCRRVISSSRISSETRRIEHRRSAGYSSAMLAPQETCKERNQSIDYAPVQ